MIVLLHLVFLVDGTTEREVFVVPLQISWIPWNHEAAGVHGQPTWGNRGAGHSVGSMWEGGKEPRFPLVLTEFSVNKCSSVSL